MDELVQQCRCSAARGQSPLAGLDEQQKRALLERYSRFEDHRDREGMIDASRVRVTELRTPRPVLHLMASNHDGDRGQWGSFWDQYGGGFSCVDSVWAGKMTSHLDTNYVPTSPEPQDVRNFYVHEAGNAWPMFPTPGYEQDKYRNFECVQDLDQLSIAAGRAALDARLDVLVHPDLPLEMWQVTLKNRRRSPRKLSWFFRLRVNVDSFPFYYFVPRVVCEGIIDDGAMVFINHDQNNKHPRTAFMLGDQSFDGYDMMQEAFEQGPGRGPLPAAVQRGQCSNSPGLQPYAGLIAAGQFDAELAPGESRTWTLAYGKCPVDAGERASFLQKVRDEVLSRPDEVRKELRKIWSARISASAAATPDADLDRYFNVWSKYQLRNQSRFVRALDKIGYRDILQDVLGLCDFEPAYARAKILEALRYQFASGRAVRQYEKFPGGGHDLRTYQDSSSWICDLLDRYVRETGDRSILEESVPYLDADTLEPSDTERGSVYDHGARAVRSLFGNTGFHGLCAIGYGDWNDALSGIGGDRGVSVWLSCACVWAAGKMAGLAKLLGRADDEAEFRNIAEEMTRRINEHAWDGQWYIYAIDASGNPIGSASCAEGRIHANVNSWALFTGVAAAAGREEQVWQALQQLATPYGHVLLSPSYTARSRQQVGRIADCMPGMFENGSIYTHGESFFLYALAMAGRGDEWLAALSQTLPGKLVPDISTGPIHQQSNFFVGPEHESFGENLFSNFTGSVTWYRRGIERALGVLAELDGLSICPSPPCDWSGYKLRKRFRGCDLHFTFRRGEHFAVTLDGQAIEGDFIPAEKLAGRKSHQIDIEYL